MADYLTTDTELTSVANAIRTKGGTSASLVYPAGFVSAIQNIPSGGTDVSDTTATASDVRTGKYFYTAAGVKTQGSIANGSATTPATTITANPSISVSSSGLITATNSKTQSVTPTVSAGYVASGTAGTITVGGSNTSQLTTQAAQTITPTTTDQTIASGKYLTGTQTIKGDANLIAANIAKDVTIFGVTGTHEGGGGGGGSTDGDVVFIDYDGTIVDAKTKAEINAMSSDSELPANPSHTGLTAQGWNWTVAQLKAQLTAMPDQKVYVGQMYVTASGKTEIDVTMPECRLNPVLTISVNGTVSVDWGDGTTPDTVTGTSETTRKEQSHTYASAGNYTISITAVSGTYAFYGSSTYTLLRKNATGNENRVYSNCVRSIRLGTGAKIGNNAFAYCYSLTSITIPSGVTSIGNSAISYCYSLTSVIIPSSVTSIGSSAFSSCYYLTNVTIPSTVTSIGDSVFYYCQSLTNVTIPSTVTSIGNNAFYACYSLTGITIPSGVTSIGNSTFGSCRSFTGIIIPSGVTSIGDSAFSSCQSLTSVTIPSTVTSIDSSAFTACHSLSSITIPNGVTSIGTTAFQNCYSLPSITIPSSVTSIGNNAFQNCYGVKEYHVLPTTVPTGGTTMFNNIVSDCIIYVPVGKLTTYQTATNWSTYASKMQEEPT